MADILKDILSSGKVLLQDTKQRGQLKAVIGKGKLPNPAKGTMPDEKDPHKLFTTRVIQERMPKKEVVVQLQKFCDQEDAKL